MPVFKIRIEIEGAAGELRPGLSARAEIITSSHDKALQVPIACVVERKLAELGLPQAQQSADAPTSRPGFGKVAFVLAGNRVEARQVRLGFATEAKVEIISGIKDGEEVVAGPYRLLIRLKHGDELRAR
jgi:HlyD family secretion protein